jgi:hypothetical protein
MASLLHYHHVYTIPNSGETPQETRARVLATTRNVDIQPASSADERYRSNPLNVLTDMKGQLCVRYTLDSLVFLEEIVAVTGDKKRIKCKLAKKAQSTGIKKEGTSLQYELLRTPFNNLLVYVTAGDWQEAIPKGRGCLGAG